MSTATNPVPPNPYSPYATADPHLRHLVPVPPEYGPPRPGALFPAGCHELVTTPDDPIEIDPATEQLAAGLCPTCVAALRGHTIPDDTRPLTSCRTCGGETRYHHLCAFCRAEAHQLWQAVRTTPAPAPAQRSPTSSFVALDSTLSIIPGALCEHGDSVFEVRLTGVHTTGDRREQEFDLILPRCHLAKMIGSVLAVVDHEAGTDIEAHDRFTDTVTRSQASVRAGLEQMHTTHNDDEQQP